MSGQRSQLTSFPMIRENELRAVSVLPRLEMEKAFIR